MNKNFRKTSLIALMSMAIMNMVSSEAMALEEGTSLSGSESVIIGGATFSAGFQNVVIGHGSTAGSKKADGSAGGSEDLTNGSVAIGHEATVFAGAWDGIALGKNAKVSVEAGIALGRDSVADRSYGNENAYLRNGKTGREWVSTNGVVSFGSEQTSRQLTGVAAGSEDTDAVNVAQLKALEAEGEKTYAKQSSLNSYATQDNLKSYATTASLESYKKEVGDNYATKTSLNAYATTSSLEDYKNDAQTNFDDLSNKVTALQTTLDRMDVDSIKDAVASLGDVDLDKIQETVSKLDKLPSNGLLTITTSTAQQQPEDPVTPPEENNPEQQTVVAAAEDGTGEGTGGDVGGETPTPDTNKEATLGVGGKLNFVSSSNVLAQVENGETGDVNVKLDLAQDANVNSLTANSVTTGTLQATKITAQDMELSGKLTANEIVATTAIQAPTIQFTDGAALTYSKDSGRLTYTTPAAEGDGTRAGGETFSVATTKDGISFGADEGESVLVNLEDQKVDIKGGDQYVTTSIVANADGGATVQIKMTDEFKAALGNGNLDNGITIGARDGYGEIRVQQGNVDMGGNRIQNVGNPIAAGDAANKQYVDSTARSLRNKINDVDKDLRAGVAMAMAVGNLPQAYMPGKSIVGVSAGTYHGQGGFALGLSHATDNRQWVFKGAASVDTRGNVGGTLSAGYQF